MGVIHNSGLKLVDRKGSESIKYQSVSVNRGRLDPILETLPARTRGPTWSNQCLPIYL